MNNSDWFKNSVIYHILIDRFAGFKSTENWEKPEFLGGNIRGIIEKLPYLEKLGIDTIWISPFYKTSEYHGYHITDFFKVDPHFGTTKDIIELIEKIHKKDMKIIADFVPNHCSDVHPYFLDAQKNKNSEYRKWFYFTTWPDKYLCFLSIRQLPKINLNNPKARSYIINAAKHWLSLGFDGYRLDHCIGPSHNFWQEFTKEIKKNYPGVVLIGEAWMKGIKFRELKTINIKNKLIKWLFGASSDKLLKEYIGELDGVLDFRFQELIKSYVAYENMIKNEFYNQLQNHYKNYPENYYLPTFLDNHDMNRFLFDCKNDLNKLKKAAKIQFSITQPHIIYYGTEKEMSQKKSIWSISAHGDIQARRPMDWDKKETHLFKFYSSLIDKKKRD